MSVINDMLRDLEARNGAERGKPAMAPVESAPASVVERPAVANHQHWRWLALVLMVVIACLLGAFLFSMFTSGGPVTGHADPAVFANAASEAPRQQASDSAPAQELAGATEPLEGDMQMTAAQVSPSVIPNETQAAASDGVDQPVATSAAVVRLVNAARLPQREEVATKASAKTTKTEPNNTPQNNTPDVSMVNVVAEPVTKPSARPAIDGGNQNAQLTRDITAPVSVAGASTALTLGPAARDSAQADAARRLIQRGESARAYRELYAFLAAAEVDLRSRAVLAGELMQAERYAEAGDLLLEPGVEADPDLRQLKARWYMQQGARELALHTLRMQLPALADYPDYHALLASYYQQQGFAAQAENIYRQLVRLRPDAAEWWAGLAIAADQQGRFKQASEAYQAALQQPGLTSTLTDFIRQRLQVLTP